ncbi:MAG: hypothetical protein WBD40_17070 [Tepidisphaeraceae bacterium]
MTASVAPSRTEPHAEYRRQARRIRGAFAQAPVLRVRALCELARHHNAMRREGEPPGEPFLSSQRKTARQEPRPPFAASSFADLVRDRMDGSLLRYSHRTRLLRQAARRGIGRFEANLIIAAVQHQARKRGDAQTVTTRASWMVAVIGLVATQGAIATGIWFMVS